MYPSASDLDQSLSSLLPVNEWFLEQIVIAEGEEDVPLPIWWNPAHSKADSPFTRWQLGLIDVTQAYFATVLTVAAPDASWVAHKGHKKDFTNGQPMLKRGKKGRDFAPFGVVYSVGLRKAYYHRDERATVLFETAEEWLAE